MAIRKERGIYKFKRGQEIRLDNIYDIQALAGGDWWEHTDAEGLSESIIITKDIEIIISSKKAVD